MELNKLHQKAFADFCGGIIYDYHGAVWKMANALAFVGAFASNFDNGFFAWQELVTKRQSEVVDIERGDFFGGGNFD